MTMQETIKAKLDDELQPIFLRIENESHMHSGPATESHFKVTAVAKSFEGLPAVQRHQRVYRVLSVEMANGIHALALHLFSPAEWEEKQQISPDSPACRGGSKSQ